ncbi:hypothetical protein QR680_003959 [Steinernema hermaphroditum]|uniref:B30.2/SPRY domain-containing protein n=1 Tax=Steinernema hermaphroditum TaxID=289476 RepID=A0AA39LT91_9BILA|nr:hypothetical protein QR680_003959 [Steinernema hermaphroditum]
MPWELSNEDSLVNTQKGRAKESCERLCVNDDLKRMSKENDVSQYIDPVLLHDPRELMKRASDVLGSMSKVKEEVVEYTQELPDPSLVEISDDVPKELEFHGEPVPESDEEDGNALFAAAAGIPHVKKTENKKPTMPDEDELIGDDEFELDYFNADLNMKGHVDDKNVIDPDVSDGFALMYGGVKANYGFLIKEDTDSSSLSSGYAFQVKIVECLSIKHVPFEETMPHDVRVGWSVDSGTSTMHVLGEAPNSFGFDMYGRTMQNFTFADYGEPLETGDIVTTVLNLRNRSIDFYKNDTHLGTAFSDIQIPQGLAMFPHVASKNCKVHVNFGRLFGTDDFKKPASLTEETIWLSDVQLREGHVIRSRIAPESKEHCTVLMMVGLPAVGKTTWVRKYLRDHPDEHWILISTDAVSNAMTINGMPRRRVHRGRWDMVMGLIAKAVTRSLHMACRRKHNYIIDMTNVSRDTRRRRLTQFKDFQRKCVVIIPSDEDFQKRQRRQARMEGTGTVPSEAMLELKAVMSIPNQDQEPIEDVVFIEPPVERIMDAIKIVNLYNDEAKPWYQKRYQRGRRGGGTYGSYGDRRREKDEDFHRPPPQKVVITQHMRTNNITSKPRYEQP